MRRGFPYQPSTSTSTRSRRPAGRPRAGRRRPGAAYAAKSLANSGATDWDEAGGAVSNKNAISFGTPTGGNWGTIVAAALKDTSGNVWAWATLTTPVATTDGVPVIFGAGKLVFRMVNP